MAKPKRGGRRSPEEAKEIIDANYGTYYSELFTSGNIKFIKSNDGSSNVPLETRTKGRIYALISDNEVKSISFYDDEGLLQKTIDVRGNPHMINGKPIIPHVHLGYPHSSIGSYDVSKIDQELIDRINKLWKNYLAGK